MVTLFIASTVVAVLFSFFCSLAEAVLLSLSPVRLETLKAEGRSFAEPWLRMRREVSRPIAAILILNTVAHTGGAIIAGGSFEAAFGARWLWAFSVAFTVVILFGTEIVPKTLGVRYNEVVAPWLTRALRTLLWSLHPVIVLAEVVSSSLKGRAAAPDISTADIGTLARLARSEDLIADEQETIIVRALALRETRVEAAMVPRDWIVCLRTDRPMDENLDIATSHFHTRYPVSESESIDGIVGYVNLKEIVGTGLRPRSLEEFLRPVVFVGSETTLNTLLRLFVTGRHHFAIVKDRTGRIVGMVTLEDVLEEVVGEIEDEFDVRSSDFVRLTPRRWKVGGGVPVSELAAGLGVAFDEPVGTFAEWVRRRHGGSIPPGWSGQLGGLRVIARQVRRGLVHQAIVEVAGEPGAD